MNRFTEQEFHKNLDLHLWKDVLAQAKPFSKTIWILGINMVLVGGLDAIFPLLTKYAIDHFIVAKQFSGLSSFSLLYLFLLLINAVFVFFLIALAGKIETGMNNNLRKKCNKLVDIQASVSVPIVLLEERTNQFLDLSVVWQRSPGEQV